MSIKEKAIEYRKQGKTYSEIIALLDNMVSKGTLSYWCKNIKLSLENQKRIEKIRIKNLEKSREIALVAKSNQRNQYFRLIKEENKHIFSVLNIKENAKVILAVLYEAEGSKIQRGSLMFGNSNPDIIKLFLRLLRLCYEIDKSKFRCTLQGRADQNVRKLEIFWSNVTKIPLSQFYKARIDSRTIGKISKKKDYKGVCRIDYFSAKILIELKIIASIIYEGL